MAKRDWKLIEALTSAMGRANTLRKTPRAIGTSLRPRWDARLVQLDLRLDERRHHFTASFHTPKWTTDHEIDDRAIATSKALVRQTKTGQTLILPLRAGEVRGRLRIQLGIDSERVEADPLYLGTLARIVEVGLGHQLLLRKVADLSRSAHAENRILRKSLGTDALTARSPAMLAVKHKVFMVARYDTPVLILGESGVGKERVARLIHANSPRANHPFVQLNCGAIPDQLVESELFGHERGAFTGATRAHRGVFQQAHGGVLLLDEVGELPLSQQVALLRVLQEGTIRPVGSEREVNVDVRVIAATNRRLADMVAAGDFREDLYYRLNVFPIEVPPLRDRALDMPALVQSLVLGLSKRLRIPPPRISPSFLSQVRAYHWPGNVRELSNALEASLILGGGHSLALAPNFGPSIPSASQGSVLDFSTAVRQAIERALLACGGKLYGEDGAAAALGLHPATLQSKMRKLGIQRQSFITAD